MSLKLLVGADGLAPDEIKAYSNELSKGLVENGFGANLEDTQEDIRDKGLEFLVPIVVSISAQVVLERAIDGILDSILDILKKDDRIKVVFSQDHLISGRRNNEVLIESDAAQDQAILADIRRNIRSTFGPGKNPEDKIERRRALIIANRIFEDDNIGELKHTGNDAKKITDVLGDANIGNFEIFDTIVDGEFANIQIKIGEFFQSLSPDDTALFYYSGHGIEDIEGNLYLAASDTRKNNLVATSVSINDIVQNQKNSKCEKLIAILDCCNAASASKDLAKSLSTIKIPAISSGRGQYWLAAAGAGEIAQESDHLKGGVFTHHIVEGLRTGRADINGDGYISISELDEYVANNIGDTAIQKPDSLELNVSGRSLIIAAIRSQIIEFQREFIVEKISELYLNKFIHTKLLDEWKHFCDEYAADSEKWVDPDQNRKWTILHNMAAGDGRPSEAISEWRQEGPPSGNDGDPANDEESIPRRLFVQIAAAVLIAVISATLFGEDGRPWPFNKLYESSEQKIAALTQDLNASRTSLDTTRNEYQQHKTASEAREKDLKTKISGLSDQAKALQTSLQAEIDKTTQLQDSSARLGEDLKLKSGKLEKALEDLATLKFIGEKASAKLSSDLSDVKSSLAKAEKKESSLLVAITDLKKRSFSKDTLISSLTGNSQTLNSLLADKNAALGDAAKKIKVTLDYAAETKNRLSKQLKAAEDALVAASEAEIGQSKQISLLQNALTHRKAELGRLQTDYDKAISAARTNADFLNTKLSFAISARDAARQELKKTKELYEKQNSEIADLRQSSVQLQELMKFGPGWVKPADRTAGVHGIQAKLQEANCYLGFIDGDPGDETVAGVRRSLGDNAADNLKAIAAASNNLPEAEFRKSIESFLNQDFRPCNPPVRIRDLTEAKFYRNAKYYRIRGRFPATSDIARLRLVNSGGSKPHVIDAISTIQDPNFFVDNARARARIKRTYKNGRYAFERVPSGEVILEFGKRDQAVMNYSLLVLWQ